MFAFSGYEWMVAGRYLRARRKETFISVIAGFSFLGIMLGVATLIVVMAVMNGFRTELLNKILGINGHIVLQPVQRQLDDYDAVAKRVEGVDEVLFAVPFVEGQALASGVSASQGVLVRGVRKADLDKLQAVSNNIKLGSLEQFGTQNGVAIGRRLANALGLTIGDNLTLVTPRGNVTPFGVTPRIKSYPVDAIFEVGMSEFDMVFVYMPIAEAQTYFNMDGIASGIDVYIQDPDNVAAVREPVEEAAGRPLITVDWRQRNVTFFAALEVERNVMFLILTMIVLVAVLNIVSGLIMLVKDKGRDIAILRTMGASRASVMRIFLITGASIGTIGTICGFLLGFVICLNVENIRRLISSLTSTELFSPELYYLSRLPADMDPTETSLVVLMALVLSFLATLYPAWRAAKLDPIEALRYE
jgi:lipoprotein-releasing system permease protein